MAGHSCGLRNGVCWEFPFLVGTYGRLRTVEPAIDGNLWLATSDAAGDKDSIPNNTETKILKVTLNR